jgi:hypothetical protein
VASIVNYCINLAIYNLIKYNANIPSFILFFIFQKIKLEKSGRGGRVGDRGGA